MNRKVWTTTGAVAAVALLAGAIAWVRAARTPAPLAPAPVFVQGIESHLLDAANIIEPYDEMEVPDLILRFRSACLESCRELSGEAALDRASMESFCDAAADRLRLYLAPSYEGYRDYAKRLTGRDPQGSKVMNIAPDREHFDKRAEGMRLLPFDPASVHARAVYIEGRSVAPVTAHASYTPDSGLFFSPVGQEPKKARATIYEVLVPVKSRDPFDPDNRFSLVLGLAFVRTSDGRWMPWRMSLHDPSNSDRVNGSPWL